MMALLDVNVLFALHQPKHSDFETAQGWFTQNASNGFATCPFTQAGLLRLLTRNPFGLDAYSMAEARAALGKTLSRAEHVFWPDRLDYLRTTEKLAQRMQGHRQITDAYLLGVAVQKRGKLATLDRGILQLAGSDFAVHVELIGSGKKVASRYRTN